MPHTYSKLLYHVIFATKYRAPLILPEIKEELHARLRRLIQEKGGVPLEVGGIDDHVHLLLECRPRFSMSALVQEVKGSSSHWMQELGKPVGESFWQGGYSIFTVSASACEATRRYIQNQEIHHRKRSSRNELILLLRRHSIPFDPDRLDD
jgi:REP element-mobilizing transposase RayT